MPSIVYTTMVYYQLKGWEFAPGTAEKALEEAAREIHVGGIVRAIGAINLVLKYGRTDNLCICGHWHP